MVALKPPYALAVGLPALYVLWRAGPRALLGMIEIPAAALVALGYAFIAWRFFPAYAQNMLPALVDVYLAVRQSAFELIHSEGGLDFLALMIFGALLGEKTSQRRGLPFPRSPRSAPSSAITRRARAGSIRPIRRWRSLPFSPASPSSGLGPPPKTSGSRSAP